MPGRTLSLLLPAILVCVSQVVAAAAPVWSEAINMAGRQRMLTQRVAKSYIQAGLGANRELALAQLADAVDLFERQHAELSRLDLPDETRQLLARIGSEWKTFRTLATAGPARERVGELVAQDGRLLAACEQVVVMLEADSGTPQGRLVNMSGRQRMLSQRIAKNYMLVSAGLAGPDTVKSIQADRAEFRQVLNTLLSERHYSAQIAGKLGEVAAQWVWVESALDMTDDTRYPLIVADACEKILNLLESLTKMYAAVEAA